MDVEKGALLVQESQVYVRNGFLRRVYMLLCMQLAATSTGTIVAATVPSVTTWLLRHGEVTVAVLLTTLAVFCALMALRKRHPWNAILLGFLTLGITYIVGHVSAMYSRSNLGIYLAFSGTTTCFVLFAVYTHVMLLKHDVTFLRPFLLTCCIVLVFTGAAVMTFADMSIAMFVSAAGTILYTSFLLHDTSALRWHMGPDDAIEGAAQIYLDVINLFLCLLN